MNPFYEPLINAAQLQQIRQNTDFAKQEQPYHMQILQAQAKQSTAKAQDAADDVQAMQMARQAIQDAAKSGKQLSAADALEVGASTLANAGRLNSAATMLDKVELARSREERQKKLQVEEETAKLKQQEQRINWLQSALGNVKDQPSLDAAVKSYEAMTGEQVPETMRKYSPELIETLNNAVMKAKDRAILEARARGLDLREKDIDSKIKEREQKSGVAKIRAQTAERRVELSEDRERRLGKEGGGKSGKGSVVPPKTMIDHASSIIKNMFPTMPKSELAQYARDAAADAMGDMKSGADMKASVYAAIQRNASNIQEEIKHKGWFTDEKENKYKGAGASEKTALPMPDSIDKMIPGRYYKDSKGVVRQYNPKGQ